LGAAVHFCHKTPKDKSPAAPRTRPRPDPDRSQPKTVRAYRPCSRMREITLAV
jgi:hypothetical protein